MTLEDIGEKDDAALICRTNLTPCCRFPYTGKIGLVLGNWFFPDGRRIGSDDNPGVFYRTRGQMMVNLNRKRGGEDGIYRCEITIGTSSILD